MTDTELESTHAVANPHRVLHRSMGICCVRSMANGVGGHVDFEAATSPSGGMCSLCGTEKVCRSGPFGPRPRKNSRETR